MSLLPTLARTDRSRMVFGQHWGQCLPKIPHKDPTVYRCGVVVELLDSDRAQPQVLPSPGNSLPIGGIFSVQG
jgi:hypothetical protein